MKMFVRFGKLAVVVLLGLVFSASALAQFRSAIEGTVTDSSGAVVPDAKVTLTNVDTGISTSVQSNGEGLFRFPSLPPGRYKVTTTKQGFATTTQENIVLLEPHPTDGIQGGRGYFCGGNQPATLARTEYR